MATAVDFYKDLKSRAEVHGRNPDSLIILPGFSPIIAGPEAEAKQVDQELNELADVEVGRKRLTGRFGGTTSRTYRWTDRWHWMTFPIRPLFRRHVVAPK